MTQIVVITGASSGFGAMTARHLADAGHVVYAGMRDTVTRNASAAQAARDYATDHQVDLRPIEMDVADQGSVDAAIDTIVTTAGRLDVIVHNAGHMTLGPAEAFTPDEVAQVYDTNVLSTQRVNRAALPHLRAQRDGLVIWVGSSSSRGGTPPYLAPYFAAKAAMDALAVSYAAELARFGIETSIIVPGSFTVGTNHFAHAGHPSDTNTAEQYDQLYPDLMEQVSVRLADLAPAEQDPTEVARAITGVVGAEKGDRPFRVHIDPAHDGAEEVFDLGDRIRTDFYRRLDLSDLLRPAVN
ncbi:SDR family oxidoreductase [Williamsia phyllosphaerae]|uniref:Short-chain dehydrogenase/reductase n=1 Tax=Williamsia phyllosphaerae TaxID=885042 RepID=A0ABQ1UIB0_9NOCA|nr:SDR family oxidoreductase [Williamsia phyllosphaerae]GGF19709.1 short-chain dehydrogenase/reductase [Williamsia phyllosphaerae]